MHISQSYALRRLGKVSIDLKFYLVIGSGHNLIPQKWDLFRWMYTYMSGLESKLELSKKMSFEKNAKSVTP